MSSCHNMQCDVQVAERRIKMDGAEISAINEENAEIKEVITKGVGVKVGDGTKTRLWEDKWVCEDSLMNRFPRLSMVLAQKRNFISECGIWDGCEWIWNLQWSRELFLLGRNFA